MAMKMTVYQCVTRNFLSEAMLSSDRRILRRVAKGPDGSTCKERFITFNYLQENAAK